jgi:hypothetical protein
MKKFIMAITVGSTLVGNASAAQSIRPSRLLINSFGVQCPQVIPRTVGSALVNLNSLYGVVQDLKSTNECNGSGDMSSVLANYSNLVEKFSSKENEAQQQLVLEKQIALYTQMLSNNALTPAQITYVENQIIQSQTSLVNIKAGLIRFQDFSGRESQGANQLVSSLDGFLSYTLANQSNACYQNKTAQVTNLISNVLMTTAAFATPGASLALATSGVVTSTIGKFIGDAKFNKTMSNINDVEMPLALRCVSEVLTEQYCSARETVDLINDNIDSQNKSNAKFDGINLLRFQLNKLSLWLEAIHAGSPVTSEGDLVNRKKSKKQGELLEDIKMAVDAYSAKITGDLKEMQPGVEQSGAIANAMERIVLIMASGEFNGPNYYGPGLQIENPLFNSIKQAAMPYAIVSQGNLTNVPECGSSKCTSVADYIAQNKKPLLGTDDWDKSLIYVVELLRQTRVTNEAEKAKVISVDVPNIFGQAKRSFAGETNAYDALLKIKKNAIRIVKYLNEHASETRDYKDQTTLINTTMTLSQQIANLIDESFILRATPIEVLPLECRTNQKPSASDTNMENDQFLAKKSLDLASCVSKILKLEEGGTNVFFTKVRNMVSFEMEARFHFNDLGEGVQDLINSTKYDLVQTILNSYSSPGSSISTGQVKGSLEDSQKASKETLNQFFDFFKNDLLTALKDPKLSGFAKNDLCFRVLPYLDDTKKSMVKEISTVCGNAIMQEYKNGPIIRFSDFVIITPRRGLRPEKITLNNSELVADRFCGYRKYNHANQLVELQNEQSRKLLNLNSQFSKMKNKLSPRM